MSGLAGHGDAEDERAALRDDEAPQRRLGDEHAVRPVTAQDRRERAEAAVLLADRCHDEHITPHGHAGFRQRLPGDHHRDDAALHVDRAAPVDAVADALTPDLVGPERRIAGLDDIDVALHHQRPAAAGAWHGRDEVRSSFIPLLLADVEDVLRDLVAGRLPAVDLPAAILHRRLDDVLHRALVQGDAGNACEGQQQVGNLVAVGIDPAVDAIAHGFQRGGGRVDGHSRFLSTSGLTIARGSRPLSTSSTLPAASSAIASREATVPEAMCGTTVQFGSDISG